MTFRYIDPPFKFNAANVAKYPEEVTGNYLLKRMAERLAWKDFHNRRVYDLGCGVRFARAIANLELDFNCYVGIDVNTEAIRWLEENLSEPKFRFAHFDAQNSMYNPEGKPMREYGALPFAGESFDVVTMFSVITHQLPSDAAEIFALIRKSLATEYLYFTASIDKSADDYIEGDPANPLLLSTYNPGLMTRILRKAGWRIERIYEPSPFQLTAFVCSPA
jgi:SAM-dependent methyltransferase